MFESKVSTSKSVVEGSSMHTSTAPGFIPIPCPTHCEYSITNICKTPNCIQPLCPECIPAHVQLHQETKQPAKIENIISTRIKCIEQLATMKYDAQKQSQEIAENSRIDQYIESHQRKLDTAYKKISKLVEEIFTQFSQQFEVMASAFQAEKDKREREICTRLAPLNEYLSRISQAKQELESDDYIPMLIELLNQPPSKPKVDKLATTANYGAVEINEQYFEDIKKNVLKFVNVKVSENAGLKEGRANLHKSNYYNSNNMKFSRLERSVSREGSKDDLSRRSSTKNIRFGAESIISGLRTNSNEKSVVPNLPSSNNCKMQQPLNCHENPRLIVKNDGQMSNLKLARDNYFTHQSSLVYFKESSSYFYSVQLNCVEAGFRKVQIAQQGFRVPLRHKTVILPNGKIVLMGGENMDEMGQATSNCMYQVYNENQLRNLQSMNHGRSDFGACYFNQAIFVCGGLATSSGSRYDNKKPISSCEVYSLHTGRWNDISPLPEPCYRMTICPIGNKILKCGGFLDSQQYLHRVHLYCPIDNIWTAVEGDRKFLPGIGAGVVQISKNSTVIFGGYNPVTHTNQAVDYIVEYKQDGGLEVSLGKQLYNEACFQSAYVYNGAIYAIQENESKRGKLIMGYKYDSWKFISC